VFYRTRVSPLRYFKIPHKLIHHCERVRSYCDTSETTKRIYAVSQRLKNVPQPHASVTPHNTEVVQTDGLQMCIGESQRDRLCNGHWTEHNLRFTFCQIQSLSLSSCHHHSSSSSSSVSQCSSWQTDKHCMRVGRSSLMITQHRELSGPCSRASGPECMLYRAAITRNQLHGGRRLLGSQSTTSARRLD